MSIIDKIFKNKTNKSEEATIVSSPYNFVESILPNAKDAANISRMNLANFEGDIFTSIYL